MAADPRERLLARQVDIAHAMRTLADDRSEGMVDDEAYRQVTDRFQQEAATLRDRLASFEKQLPSGSQSSERRFRPSRWIGFAAFGAVGAAVVIYLVLSLQSRSGTQTITGSEGQPAPPSQLQLAQRQVRLRPRNFAARMRLGRLDMRFTKMG
ncbi:MAG: hypothetical protein ACRDFS_04520, partial [Chloroflexota bacterium]